MIKFSVIIPVFNRPDELKELLESLKNQTFKNFEVIVVEDGSTLKSDEIVEYYKKTLDIKYFFKTNSGPGQSRNYGSERAVGDYQVFFDSDCIIPQKYFEIVNQRLSQEPVDAYGGPDMAHPDFSAIQKSINYSMTSFFTTGGIRGGMKNEKKFHPRSFNMGFTKEVFEKTKGFSKMRFGEDVDMSLRIIELGFSTTLIKEAAVYHKRRVDFRKFFKQVYNSGIARINLYKRHPQSLKLVHFLPALFLVGESFLILFGFFNIYFLIPLGFFAMIIFLDSLRLTKNLKVACLSVISSFIQLTAYGLGFIKSFYKRIILKQDEFHAYAKNFYK
ncbi:MAG TPA: glycosyl transferase family 2 [Bacteroidales bacterium]|nr:glycosyl transferase family 2 [Bacteroidales bacterium]